MIETTLKLKLKTAKKIAILGIGSELRADDAAGVITVKALDKKLKQNKLNKHCKVFNGETAPENLTGEIKKFKPSHLIIIDAIDCEGKPGDIAIIDFEKTQGISFSTHRFPVKILADYIYQSVGCKTILIGIKPKTMEFNQPMSKVVEKSVASLIHTIYQTLSTIINFRANSIHPN